MLSSAYGRRSFRWGVGGCRGARTSPPTSISAVAAGDAVRSVSFLLGGTVIGVEATWFTNEAHVVNGSS